MKRSLVFVVAALLALAGCSGTAGERDESAYLEMMTAVEGGTASTLTDSELIEHGDLVCDMARDLDGTITEGAEQTVRQAEASGASAASITYWRLVGASAHNLCPDLK